MFSIWQAAIGFFVVLTCIGVSSTQSAWKKLCYSHSELAFFKAKVSYAKARERCWAYKGHLVKVNSVKMTEEINKIISGVDEAFFIGASDRKKEGKWIWEDDTKVPLRNETGYQNWKSDQPSHGKPGAGKDCVVIAKGDFSWRDSTCNEPRNFICQRPSSANVHIATDRREMPLKLYCVAARCPPKPTASWYRNGSEVSTSEGSKIYQKKWAAGGATLFLENATLSDSGNYACVVKNERQLQKVIVPAKPTILGVKNFSCNSSLKISWRPHKSAVDFQHQVKVFGYAGKARILTQKPKSTETRNIIIRLLDEDSLIDISIKACGDNCSTGQSTATKVRTGRRPRFLSSVKMTQRDWRSTCNVEWTWKGRDRTQSPGDFWVTRESFILKSRNRTEVIPKIYSVNINDNDSYSFIPEPNRRYGVKVRSDDCDGPGETMKAIGYCAGSPQAPTRLEALKVTEDENKVYIQIPRPDERAGLVSCMFVILRIAEEDDDKHTSYSLESLQKLDRNGSLCHGYIAAAIQVSSFSEKDLRLGDLSRSSCNVFDTGTTSNSGNRSLLEGVNHRMISGQSYSAHVVSTTPSGDKIHTQTSPFIDFHYKGQINETYQTDEESGFKFQVFSFMVGICSTVVAGLIYFLIRWIIKTNSSKQTVSELEQDKADNFTNAYENFQGQSLGYVNGNNVSGDVSTNATLGHVELPARTSGYEIPLSGQQEKGMLEPAYETFTS